MAIHMAECADCRALQADFRAIGAVALEMAREEVAPPEWLWTRIRAELEAEGRIHEPADARGPVRANWWAAFQRPAIASAVLGIAVIAAGILGVGGVKTNSPTASAVLEPIAAPMLQAQIGESQTAGSLDASEAAIVSLPQRDPQVAEELHHDLGQIDNFIAVCEKSVREQPDNEMAREYLYDAYQQKAQLLAVAMDRSAVGGR
ncbi:MAG: hypothetical protein WA871_12810 [Candidatus Acidiferrales bacterium]